MSRITISLLFFELFALTNAFNILYLVPFPAPSHWFWLKNFSEELLKRGHHVTVVTNYKRPEPHPNYTEIIINPPYNVMADFPPSDFFSMKYDGVLENLYLTWDVGLKSTEHAFRDKNVAAFLNQTDRRFDVVVLEQFFHDSWLPIAKIFNAPLVTIATLGHADYFDNAMGLITPSYVPHHVLTFTDNMNFVQRSVNLFWRLTDAIIRKYYYMEKMQEMADRYLNYAFSGAVPSILELEKNISFRIVNTHQSMQFVRPAMPGMVYIGGAHIKPSKELPADVQEFLDNGSEHGVIYFSFGSCIGSADLPIEKLHAFIETFRLVKQKVLWKFENDTLPNMPPNVMIRKWLPQNEILAHKNVVLFLTHGGIFGTQEGIYWAVPMVFIPIYSDQFRNGKRCVDAGLAEMLRFPDVSVQNLLEKLNMVLTNKKYANQVQLVSEQFRDNLVDPMAESMYWIEFIARHKHNYPIFKPNAPNVSLFTYLYLDILLAVVIALYITFKLTKYALRKVWERFDRGLNIKSKRFVFLVLVFHLFTLSKTFDILFLAPFPAPSHWFWLKHFVEELLNRGHHVTAVTNYRRPEPHANYTEILIMPPYADRTDFPPSNFFSMKYDSVLENLYLTWDVGLKCTEHAFRDKNVAAFLNQTDRRFDVVVLEQFFHDSWLPIAKIYNAPLVTIATLGHADYFDNAMGLTTPSYVPHHVLTFTDNMNFMERCVNLFWRLTDAIIRKYYYMEKMQEMAENHLKHAFPGAMPSILELEKNISFRIINTHECMQFARPKMPSLTYVAGIHIKPPNELPSDIQEFLDSGSEHGVIYFTFGSCINSADLPPEKLSAFIEAFRRLKQKVLWKFEKEAAPNMPSNVMVRKWLPQNAILAHKNVVLFLTHGGIFGMQEAIHWAVPMVFIPVYADQFRNSKRGVDAGIGEMLSFHDISEKNVLDKLNRVLNDNGYLRRAKLVSEQFRDNLVDPMAESMFWIEFIARHKHNYPILKPNAPNVSWFVSSYLDVLLAAVITLYITFKLTKFTLKIVWQRFDSEKNLKRKMH